MTVICINRKNVGVVRWLPCHLYFYFIISFTWRSRVYIQYPDGHRQTKRISAGFDCTNYRLVETLICVVSSKASIASQVVFLTDALSVVKAVHNNNNKKCKICKENAGLRDISNAVDTHTLSYRRQWVGWQNGNIRTGHVRLKDHLYRNVLVWTSKTNHRKYLLFLLASLKWA